MKEKALQLDTSKVCIPVHVPFVSSSPTLQASICTHVLSMSIECFSRLDLFAKRFPSPNHQGRKSSARWIRPDFYPWSEGTELLCFVLCRRLAGSQVFRMILRIHDHARQVKICTQKAQDVLTQLFAHSPRLTFTSFPRW